MKMKPIICAITLICMFVSSPMAVAIDRDTIRSKAQSALKATQGKVASAGTSAWQTMSKSAVIKKANMMLKTLKEDMKCLSRWDCTPAQRKRIMKEVSALMALVVIILVGGYLWKRNTQAERETLADRLGMAKPLTEEQTKAEEARSEKLKKLIITTDEGLSEKRRQEIEEKLKFEEKVKEEARKEADKEKKIFLELAKKQKGGGQKTQEQQIEQIFKTKQSLLHPDAPK